MSKTLLLVTSLAFAAPPALSAQTFVTAPAGFEQTNSNALGYNVALFFREGRTQVGDPTIPKRSGSYALLDVAWRPTTNVYYTTSQGMARKWTNVTLTLGHTDCAKLSSRFTQNYLGTGTVVFAGAWSLPALSGFPAYDWGRAGSLKFSKSFVYNGKDDLLQDWKMRGGAFVGSSNWSASYFLDGCYGAKLSRFLVGGQTPHSPGSKFLPLQPPQSLCADSSQTASNAYATTQMAGALYSDSYPTVSLRGLFQIRVAHADYLARSAPFVAAVTVGGSDAGYAVGTKCNRLHVNMGFPFRIAVGKTDSRGTALGILPIKTFPYKNGWDGLEIYGQTAWNDSRTGALALTRAVKLVMTKKPTGGYVGCLPGCVVYRYREGSKWLPSTASAWGYVQTGSTLLNPVDRYRTR